MSADLSTHVAAPESSKEIASSSGTRLRPDPELRTIQPTEVSIGDAFQRSTGLDIVEKLKTQLNGIPDVRQLQVEALKSAVANGIFRVCPDRIAESLLKGGE
jgi:anti-sigma28 factor (negative regulator of flagellin synthesis)